MPRTTGWFKSSYSSGDNASCVEVKFTDAAVKVRDSKNPRGPRLHITPEAWTTFIKSVQH